MSGSIAIYDMLQPIAFAGMKGDSMDDNVDSHPSSNEIPFGRICAFQGANSNIVGLGPVALIGPVAGIALHDHVVGAYGNGYRQYDAVSVLTRGRAWCEVAAGAVQVAMNNPVSFITSDGTVTGGTVGTAALPNAVFKSGIITIPPLFPSLTIGAMQIALVELHYGLI